MARKRQLRSSRGAQHRSTRSGRQIASYREISSSEEEDDDAQPDLFPQPLRSSNRTTRKRRRSVESLSSDDEDDHQYPDNEYQQNTPKKRRVTVTKSRSTTLSAEPVVQINLGKVINWSSLPYAILCQIFHYASMPLCDERFRRTPSTQWLLETSTVCHAFTEPCLRALYRCPPLAAMNHAHELVQHLKADQNAMSMNYRNKIESIKLEVSSTAAYSYAGQGVLDIHGLVRNSTMLKDLEIYHEKDFAPYQNLKESIKWSYPDALFNALAEIWAEEVEEFDRESNTMITKLREHGPIKLRSWRWSSRLAGKNQKLHNLQEIHLTSSFNSLQKIAFVNYQMPKVSREKQDKDDVYEAKLAKALTKAVGTLVEAIQVLPNLQHLIFESCGLVNSELLPLLPGSLQILEIINCSELEADDMTAFLVSKGGHLRELILNHNQTLSLSFLPFLGLSCPHLEVLRMNLHYYNQYSGMQDSNPIYETLLFVDEVPTWPSSLRIIDLNQLRNWDIETAEMFFQSITDSAAQLPHLRQLTIKATLSTNLWKVRAEVRTKWEETLKKVFLSNRPLPNPAWTSIEAFISQKESSSAAEMEQIEVADDEDDVIISSLPRRNTRSQDAVQPQQVLPSHRSTRFQSVKAPRKLALYNDPVPLLEREKRSTRSRITYAEPESSDESEDELGPPSTPEHTNASHDYSDLVSPPNSSRKTNEGGDQLSSGAILRMNKLSRELAMLHATAGNNGAVLPSSPPASDLDSDDEPRRQKGVLKKKGVDSVELFVQGMCDKVDISIGNLRPREEEMTEGDFLDSEPDDDSDWDGDDRIPGDEEIAWY